MGLPYIGRPEQIHDKIDNWYNSLAFGYLTCRLACTRNIEYQTQCLFPLPTITQGGGWRPTRNRRRNVKFKPLTDNQIPESTSGSTEWWPQSSGWYILPLRKHKLKLKNRNVKFVGLKILFGHLLLECFRCFERHISLVVRRSIP